MIDTVKFRLPCTPETINLAKTLSSKQNSNQGDVYWFNYQPTLASSDRHLNVMWTYRSPEVLWVEFSPCKAYYGTNVIVPRLEDIKVAVEDAYFVLLDALKVIPPVSDWEVQRVDVAVMWDYGSLSAAQSAISSLVKFGTGYYKTTVYKDKDKFYLKYPEYMSRTGDYHHFMYQDAQLAGAFSRSIKGYLRFEAKITGNTVKNTFKGNTWGDIIDKSPSYFLSIISGRLNKFFTHRKLIKMNLIEAYKLLVERYGVEQASSVFSYLVVKDSKQTPLRKSLLNKIPRSTRYRFNKYLKECQIGIDDDSKVRIPDMSWILLPQDLDALRQQGA